MKTIETTRVSLKTGESIKFYKFEMDENYYHSLNKDYCGLCTCCGEIADTCEPDARRYTCESCDKKSVYGMQELLLMGFITII